MEATKSRQAEECMTAAVPLAFPASRRWYGAPTVIETHPLPAQTPPELQLTYQPDFRDLFEASAQLRLRRYPARQRLRLNLVNIGSMLAGGIVAGGGGVLIAHFVPAIPVWASMGMLFLALGLFYVKVLAPWLLAQSAAIVHDAHPPGPMDFTSDAAGLRWQSEEIDFRLHWSGVEAVFCTPQGDCLHERGDRTAAALCGLRRQGRGQGFPRAGAGGHSARRGRAQPGRPQRHGIAGGMKKARSGSGPFVISSTGPLSRQQETLLR